MPYRHFLSEKEFAERMQNEVIPDLRARRHEERFTTKTGVTLFNVRFEADAPRGSVVILHGMSENAEKYRELIYYFLKNDLSVFIYDQRGHGRSTRVAEAGVVYVKKFAEYESDLAELLAAYGEMLPEPHYLFSHSMGGAVAALHLERDQDFFSRALFCSPMIEMHIKGAPMSLLRTMCKFETLAGNGEKRLRMLSPAAPPEKEQIHGASCASPARFEAYRAAKIENPRLRGAKPSYGWINESLAVTKRILARKKPERIKIPVRIYTAERDHLVKLAPQRAFAARIPDCHIFLVAGAKHELFNERDVISHAFFEEVLSFFEA